MEDPARGWALLKATKEGPGWSQRRRDKEPILVTFSQPARPATTPYVVQEATQAGSLSRGLLARADRKPRGQVLAGAPPGSRP